MNLILASASPRRRQLLEQVGLRFAVQASDLAEEAKSGLSPAELAVSLAADKALAVTNGNPGAIVIGADTMVVFEHEIFGKPADKLQSNQMLVALSGKQHQVITGVAVAKDGVVYSDYSITLVTFRHLTEQEIENYLAAAEWVDKAGAYGIQGLGALLVERIEGCYFNVVGLPLVTLMRLLQRVGVHVL